jgi:hypothetical protein
MRRLSGAVAIAGVLAIAALTAAASAPASGPVWAYCGKAIPKTVGAYTDKACSVESPSHEGKYELTDGIGKGKGFKGKVGGNELHGVNDPSGEFNMSCLRGSISGHFVAPDKLAGVVISLSKCETNVSDERKTCGLVTEPLSGELGWLDEAKGEAGVKLTSEAEPEAGLTGEEGVCVPEVRRRWRGSMIGRWGPVGKVAKESTFTFTAQPFFEEDKPRYDETSNPPAFEGEEGIHILRSEVEGPLSNFEWTSAGNPGALEGAFAVKGEALMVH